MWPFENGLKEQDALERYRRWLRRWLLDDCKEPLLDKFSRFKSRVFKGPFCE